MPHPLNTGDFSNARQAISLAAFRRNGNSHATELRGEIPLLLGRLAAEVPGSTFELLVRTDAEGVVSAELAVEAGDLSGELISEVAAVLEPIAEVEPVDTAVARTPPTVWPLVASVRAILGFRQAEPTAPASVVWSSAGTRGVPELVELVSPYAGVGIRVRLRAADEQGPPRSLWDVDFALTTRGERPSLRLRAAVRTLYPGLEVSAHTEVYPALLRVTADELPAAFAVPIAGDEPIPGAYVGTAAPLPLHPTRMSLPAERAIRVGSAVTVSGKRVDVALGLEERLRHIHVLGRTGTGKSSFLAGFMHEVASSGDGALVLDPHGPLVDRIVAELPDSARDRTWVVRCGDTANPVPLNPMAVDDQVRREIAIDDICSTFQYLFDPAHTGIVGPRFHERVAMGLRALASIHGNRASLLDVPAALGSDTFMRRAADLSGDDRLRAWVKNDRASRSSNEYGEVVSWVNSKFEAFSSTMAMRAILGSGEDALDVGAAMDSGRIVLVDLSKSDLGESATRLLGYLYLSETWAGALQREDRRRPFTVVVDEAQSMISGSLSAMLSEGRKFGLSVVLAHQYLGQLDANLLPALEGNVATTVAFRGSGADAPALQRRFGDAVDTPTLMTLPDLSAITLRTAAHVTGEPYTLIVDHNDRARARSADDLRELHAELTAATVADLVEPYRERTTAAAQGRSNVAAEPPPARPSAPAPRPSPHREPDFLEEWLAKRAKAKEENNGGSADPDAGLVGSDS